MFGTAPETFLLNYIPPYVILYVENSIKLLRFQRTFPEKFFGGVWGKAPQYMMCGAKPRRIGVILWQ